MGVTDPAAQRRSGTRATFAVTRKRPRASLLHRVDTNTVERPKTSFEANHSTQIEARDGMTCDMLDRVWRVWRTFESLDWEPIPANTVSLEFREKVDVVLDNNVDHRRT